MNGVLKLGLLIILGVFILKFALKLASHIFIGLLCVAVLVLLVGIFKEVQRR